MRLKFVDYTAPQDRRALKPAVGDTVTYEGTKYKVTEVGLKYVRMVLASGGKKIFVAKIGDVSKVFPDMGGVSADLNFNP